MKDKILDAFTKPMLSIDIGSRHIKIVEGKYNVGKVLVSNAILVPTPSDAFYDGKIADKERIREAIEIILKKKNIKTRNVSFTMESMDAVSREIVLPWAKPEELKQMIEYEAGQYLPVEMDEHILQYKVMDEFEENGAKKVTVLIVALPKEIGEDYLDLGKSMGMVPHYLDTHSNAVHKLLPLKTTINNSYPLDGQTIAAIDLGHQFINITIINEGRFKFSRLLNHGGKDIDMNIANLFNITPEEAEVRKMEIKDINHDAEQDASVALRGIVEETISDWLSEIQKIFRYYTSRSANNVIDSICIYGGGSNIEGIPTYIQKFFNMPTFKIDNLNNVRFGSNSEASSISSYVNALGVIIRR